MVAVIFVTGLLGAYYVELTLLEKYRILSSLGLTPLPVSIVIFNIRGKNNLELKGD